MCASEKRCTGNFGARTGHRFYNPDMGRWLNRDPIAERGGVAMYAFVMNQSQNAIDYNGLIIQWIIQKILGGMGKKANSPLDPISVGGPVLFGPCAFLGSATIDDDCGKCQKKICIWECIGPRHSDEIGQRQIDWFFESCIGPCAPISHHKGFPISIRGPFPPPHPLMQFE